MKVCAIHQPNFFPWIGYWMKLACADTFILLDNCPLDEQGYTRRVKIQPRRGQAFWSSLELLPHRHGTAIHDVHVNWSSRHQRVFLAQLKSAYGSLPYYSEMIVILETMLPRYSETMSISTFNTKMITNINSIICPQTKLLLASELVEYVPGQEMLIKLSKSVEADMYLSGSGAKAYLDPAIFKQKKLEIKVIDFFNLANRFIESLVLDQSILGLLSNLGSEKIKEKLTKVKGTISNGTYSFR